MVEDYAETLRKCVIAKEKEIDRLKEVIAQEVKEKYALYKRIADLTSKCNKNIK